MREFITATACVLTHPFVFLCLMLLHSVINSVQVRILPTVQVPSAFTDFFSWGDDPYTRACKARPLTVVGWTFLSVSLSLSRGKPQPTLMCLVRCGGPAGMRVHSRQRIQQWAEHIFLPTWMCFFFVGGCSFQKTGTRSRT